MFSTWSSTDHHDASSPAAKRHCDSERQHGRHASKATRACDVCKAKKARCTGARPCATCAERSLRCTYESSYLRGRPPTPLSPVVAGNNDPQYHAPSSTTTTSVLRDEQAIFATNTPYASNEIRDGTPLPFPGPSRNTDAGRSSRNSPDPAATIGNGQYVDHTSALSFLHRAYAKSKVGKAHDSSHTGTSSQPLTAAGDKPLLGPSSAGTTVNPTILPPIPNAVDSKDLFDLYFEVCVATYKPLHRPTTEKWYQQILTNLDQGLTLTDNIGNARVAVLLGVFAISTFHRQKSRGFSEDIPSLSQSDAFFKVAANLIETETGEPTLESAQARILQVFYLLMTCRMNQAWYIFGNLLQIISALGMHRRSRKDKLYSRSHSRSNYIHSQCRIRTFWCAYILDRYLGVVMGRPRHFHDKDIDQEEPARVEDADMSASGRISSEGDETDECHIDGFIWNIKLAQFVGEVSDELYPIRPLPETACVAAARRLAIKLEEWHKSLPALLKANPKHLIRSFRRQCVALKLAHKHAVMHLYRPFLLNRSNNTALSSDDEDIQLFRRESIIACTSAAKVALSTVDALAQEGPIFHAFWWTHYMTFCALSVTYVWNLQQDQSLEASEKEALLSLAARCQVHLAQATATNSPSRRYSIILEELGGLSANQHPTVAQSLGTEMQRRENRERITATATTHAFDTNVFAQSDMSLQLQDPFLHWTASDWLDLDASAYGLIPGLSPDFQWLDAT